MHIDIKDGINPLLPIIYDSSNELNIDNENIDLKLFKIDDKYLVYNKNLNKSLELSSHDFFLNKGKFFPVKSVLPVMDYTLSDMLKGESIFEHSPCIYIPNTRYTNIENVFNLYTFEYDREKYKSISSSIRNYTIQYYIDGITPFIIITMLITILPLIFRG